MAYTRAHVREALHQARRDGKPVEGLMAGDREATITLEKWGYLPIDQDAVDQRIADWYVAQGLAFRDGDTPENTPEDTPDRGQIPEAVPLVIPASSVAIEAAEAALAAATAALRLAKSMAY
jgi:hypothetical protein